MSAGLNTMSIDADLGSFDAALAGMADDLEARARPAAQAGSEVLYRAVKGNVAALGRTTGNLDRAIYQVFSKDNSGPGRATYHISWNARTAPHGHLVEWGHIQRYVTYVGSDGRLYTAIRPSMRGKPKPRRGASQAEKDAYYVLRPGGPVQVAARSFVRRAASQFDAAVDAAQARLLEGVEAK